MDTAQAHEQDQPISTSRRRLLGAGILGVGAALTGFANPALAGSRKKSPTFTVKNGKACGGCVRFMKAFLKKNKKELENYFPKGEKITFAIGRGNKSVPERTIAIGKCSNHLKDKACMFIQGCVPKDNEVIEQIRTAYKTSRLFAEDE